MKPIKENGIGVMIMAAGSSRRFGQPKQLVKYMGTSLVRHAVETVVDSSLKDILVVTGHAHDRLEKELKGLPCAIFYNRDHMQGLGSSISNGLMRLLEMDPGLEAVLIMHVDQPLVTMEHIRNLVQRYSQSKSLIVVSAYAGTYGVPVLIDKDYFDEILNLRGDQGAKRMLNDHPENVVKVHFPNAAVDIDTPEDLNHLPKNH